jgi:hypothetical protein
MVEHEWDEEAGRITPPTNRERITSPPTAPQLFELFPSRELSGSVGLRATSNLKLDDENNEGVFLIDWTLPKTVPPPREGVGWSHSHKEL